MARILEDVIVIKLSRIVKDGSMDDKQIVNDELLTTLETVAAELLGDGIVVEASLA